MTNTDNAEDDYIIDNDVVTIEIKTTKDKFNNNNNNNVDNSFDRGDNKSVLWVVTLINLLVPVFMNIFNILDPNSLLEAVVISKQLCKE